MIFPSRSPQDNNFISSVLPAILVGLFASLFAVEKIYNYDIWWHLRFGAEIVTSGAYPFTDTFSFSADGEPWINTSWLFGVLSYLLQGAVGLDGLILFKAGVIGLSFGGACRFLIRQGVHPLLAVFLLGLAVPIARFRFMLRPTMFMFPGAILFFSLFYANAPFHRRQMVGLVLVAILWINLHGSGLLAMIMAACLAVETSLKRKVCHLAECGQGGMTVQKAWLLFCLLAVSTLLTPNGPYFIRQLMDRLYGDMITQTFSSVSEQGPLLWGQYNGYWALMIVTGISFVLLRKKIRLFPLLIYIVLACLSVGSVRFVGIASFLQVIILGLNLSRLDSPRLHPYLNSRPGYVLGYLVLAALGATSFWSTFSGVKTYSWGVGIQESRYPVGAVKYLQNIGYSGNIFNTWEYGGYLLWNLPAAKVFVDGRALDSHLALQEKLGSISATELNNYLRTNQVNAAIISKGDFRSIELLNVFPDFELARVDDSSSLFLRKGLVEGTIKYKFIRLDSFDVTYLAPLAKSERAPLVEAELRHAVSQSPEVLAPAYQLAVFLDLLGKDEALDYYLKAAEINSALAFSHYSLFRLASRVALRSGQFHQVVTLNEFADNAGYKKSGEENFQLGTAFYALEKFPEAQACFQSALQDIGPSPNLLSNLGFVTLENGHFSEAEKIFQRLIDLDPVKEEGYYGLALTREKMADPEARKSWQIFLSKFPQSKYALRARQFLSQ